MNEDLWAPWLSQEWNQDWLDPVRTPWGRLIVWRTGKAYWACNGFMAARIPPAVGRARREMEDGEGWIWQADDYGPASAPWKLEHMARSRELIDKCAARVDEHGESFRPYELSAWRYAAPGKEYIGLGRAVLDSDLGPPVLVDARFTVVFEWEEVAWLVAPDGKAVGVYHRDELVGVIMPIELVYSELVRVRERV